MKTERELFLYELDGHGYSFAHDEWDEESGRFFDDQLNMVWEMWQAATQREGFKFVPVEPTGEMHEAGRDMVTYGCGYDDIYKAMIGVCDD